MNDAAVNGAGTQILLVDDDDGFRTELRRVLVSSGFSRVETVASGVDALQKLEQGSVGVLLLDMVMPGISGMELLGIIVQRYPALPVIMITAVSDPSSVVTCMKLGAFDYLTKPLDTGRLYATVTKAISFSELRNQNRRLRDFLLGEPLTKPESFANIITANDKMKSLFKLVETVAVTPHPVLICGETGVGKELLARAVHAASGVSGEFVAVNLAGLDDVMFTDTLFGHKKGAYTGATEAREGLVARAASGTLFLDEIGDLSPEMQKMLLRLLQEHEYYRLGSDLLQRSTARIVAATNRNLHSMIAGGGFRQDLYHRLASHELKLPPLRERRDDIPLLLEHFIDRAAQRLGKSPPLLPPELCQTLSSQPFSGNVRELLNWINNAVACCSGDQLTSEFFPELLPADAEERDGILRVTMDGPVTLQAFFTTFPTLQHVEQLFVQEALKASCGSKTAAAGLLGVSRPTLNRKLAEMEMKSGGGGGDERLP